MKENMNHLDLGFERAHYLREVEKFADKPIIKVIVGMRRAGKSYLLKQIMARQVNVDKVPQSQILYIDKESLEFASIRNYLDLYDYVKKNFAHKHGKKRIFIDEIQEIEGWEKAIASFHGEGADVYITGSNAKMLSSDLATLLSGRYVQIHVYSLSFEEFQIFHNESAASKEAFAKYLRLGGLPMLPNFTGDLGSCYTLLKDIFETIVLKDVITRHNIRNVGLLHKIIHYVMDNIGKTFSAKSVADYLKSQHIKLSVETVYEYLQHLCSAFVLHQIKRYDIRGKRHLEILEKYYLGDLGIRHALLGYRSDDISAFLENVVCLELLRRGYSVSIGKIGSREIDFIAEKNGAITYIQVTYLLATKETFDREFDALKSINDNHPKMVLSLDGPEFGSSFNGIQRVNVIDWLCQKT